MIIGLVGKKFSGKDTLADYLVQNHQFVKYAYAKPIKDACKTIFLVTDEQLNTNKKEIVDKRWNLTPRKMMQFLGTDTVRNNIDKDFWIKHFKYWYEENKSKNIVITDCRFQNEIDAIKEIGGMIIKINRNTINFDDHISEQGIDQLNNIDLTLDNNLTKDDFFHKFKLLNIF